MPRPPVHHPSPSCVLAHPVRVCSTSTGRKVKFPLPHQVLLHCEVMRDTSYLSEVAPFTQPLASALGQARQRMGNRLLPFSHDWSQIKCTLSPPPLFCFHSTQTVILGGWGALTLNRLFRSLTWTSSWGSLASRTSGPGSGTGKTLYAARPQSP